MINVTLHASYPPALPGHICDWAVTSVTGEPPDSPQYSQWLESLPSRIETVSVLNTMAFQNIVKSLVALWMVGLWCRLRRSFAVHQQGETRVTIMLDAGVALAVFLLARNEMLKSCIAVLAYWAVLCGEQPGALAMVLVFALAFNGCMVAGISLSFAYNAWAVLLFKVPWAYATSRLPAFETFLASLRPVKKKGRGQGRHAGAKEHECLICWTSDGGLPLRLPCRRDHLVCTECVIRLHASGQNQCPFCRLPLYTIQSGMKELCAAAMACFAAGCSIGPIVAALTCYKESSFWATVVILLAIFITAPIVLNLWQLFMIPPTANDDHLENWLVHMLMRHAFLALSFACFSVYWIWKLDKVTIVDGDLVKSFDVWMGYSFYWKS